MQGQSKIERPYQLILPNAEAYAVDDILNYICEVEHLADVHYFNSIAEARSEYRVYLIERLLKSVIEGKFELWDLYLKKVVSPPVNNATYSAEVLEDSQKQSPIIAFWRFLIKNYSRRAEPDFIKALSKPPMAQRTLRPQQNYREKFWWAKMTSILRRDLVKFCSGERISVTFEGDGKPAGSQDTNAKPETNAGGQNVSIAPPVRIQPKQKLTISDHQETLADLGGQAASSPKLTTKFNGSDEPPGKMPNTSIGKLAVRTAWRIEQEVGRKATANEVLEGLKQLVGKEGALIEIFPHGVKWMTTNYKEKNYDIEACQKTLMTWNNSRA